MVFGSFIVIARYFQICHADGVGPPIIIIGEFIFLILDGMEETVRVKLTFAAL